MAVMTADGKKLFLLVNPTRNGQGFNISYPMIYASQAHDFVEYLPAYLAHSHGTEVYDWFTPNTVTEASIEVHFSCRSPDFCPGLIFAWY